MLRRSSDDFSVLRVIRLKMRSWSFAGSSFNLSALLVNPECGQDARAPTANLGCGAKEFRCRLKERQPVVAKAHQSPVPKGLGHAFRCAEAPRAGYNSDAAEHFSGPASKKFS